MQKKPRIFHNLTIDQIGAKGQGLARHEGKIVFVDGGIPGDVADVRILQNKSSYALGRYERIHQYSPMRAEPFCTHFQYCGGCKWQHLQYIHQLNTKQQLVVEAFDHPNRIPVGEVEPILAAPKTTAYRNKLEFTFSERRWLTPDEIQGGLELPNRQGLGFHISGAFDKVLDIDTCHLMDDYQNGIRNAVRSYALEHGLSFYNLAKRTGWLRNLIVRSNLAGEWMVVIVVGYRDDNTLKTLATIIQKGFPKVVSIHSIVNAKQNDTIFDLEPELLFGRPTLVEEFGHMRYHIGPKSFFQTNPDQALHLYNLVAEYANLSPDDTLYDLYTGAGSIALFLSNRCRNVAGIELVPEAVADADANAELNGVTNCRFWAGDIRHILKQEFITEFGKPDVIVTDPPRAGMHPDVVQVVRESGARTIVYVSCNPATQARDIDLLLPAYRVVRMRPVDMFPHTYHVENVALLEKN